jgi:MFS family permease
MNDRALTEEETTVGLRYVLLQGLAGHVMGTLAGGIFVVKIALSLGASLLVIGWLAALPALAQLSQLPAIYLVEKYRRRKPIAAISLGGVRLCILGIVLVPLFFAPTAPATALTLLLALILLQGVFSAAGNSAWNSIVRDVVPEEQMGAFFSKRQRLSLLLGVPLSLAAAVFLDRWAIRFPGRELDAYSLLFSVGLLSGVCGLYFLWRTPEPEMPPAESGTRFSDLLQRPFRDENFRRLIHFLGAWNLGIALVAPFFTVYLLERLGYSMSVVIVLSVLSQLTNAAFAPIWGRLSDSFSNKTVLQVSGPLVLFATVLWLFTAMPERHVFTLPLVVVIHVLLGMSMSGVNLATGNIGMKLAPRGRATSYLAATSLVGSIAAGLGPIVGGTVAGWFADDRLSLTLSWESGAAETVVPAFSITGIDFAFLASIAVGVYSIHRLSLVVEQGEGDRNGAVVSLVSEVKRPLVNFTTAGGFSALVALPFLTKPRADRADRDERTRRPAVDAYDAPPEVE